MTQAHAHERNHMDIVLSFVAGSLFAIGLAVGGMTQPAKILNFLDVAGTWDPSLAAVMAAALATYFPATRLVARRGQPWLGECFHVPTRRDIDSKLVVGAAVFGVGWGLGGYCPGPGLTALAAGSASAAKFVAAMAVGMLLFDGAQRVYARASEAPSASGAGTPG